MLICEHIYMHYYKRLGFSYVLVRNEAMKVDFFPDPFYWTLQGMSLIVEGTEQVHWYTPSRVTACLKLRVV